MVETDTPPDSDGPAWAGLEWAGGARVPAQTEKGVWEGLVEVIDPGMNKMALVSTLRDTPPPAPRPSPSEQIDNEQLTNQ